MQVIFYNNSSGNEHVTKSLTEVATFEVELKIFGEFLHKFFSREFIVLLTHSKLGNVFLCCFIYSKDFLWFSIPRTSTKREASGLHSSMVFRNVCQSNTPSPTAR